MSKRKIILLALVFFIIISFMCKSFCGVMGYINSDVLNISIINIDEEIEKIEIYSSTYEEQYKTKGQINYYDDTLYSIDNMIEIKDFIINLDHTLNISITDLNIKKYDVDFLIKTYSKSGIVKNIEVGPNSIERLGAPKFQNFKVITKIIDYQEGHVVKNYAYNMQSLKILTLFVCLFMSYWILIGAKILLAKLLGIQEIEKLIKINSHLVPIIIFIYFVFNFLVPFADYGYPELIKIGLEDSNYGNLYTAGWLIFTSIVLLVEYYGYWDKLNKEPHRKLALLMVGSTVITFVVLYCIFPIMGYYYIY